MDLLEPDILKLKAFEPLWILGENGLNDIDIRVRVQGGGYVSKIYAIRQAIARGLIKYFEKFINEAKMSQIRDIFINYDRSLLIGDPRQTEPKKAGGKGARSKYQKSYR